MKQRPCFSLRISRVLLKKLAYIAAYEGRSKNKEVELLVRRHIAEFEKEHGKIPVELP